MTVCSPRRDNDGRKMFHLIYCSTAVRLLTPEELVRLLAQSRERNGREGITGFLVYHGGGFMQVLEGVESSVRNAFARIVRDPRHHSVTMIVAEPIEKREFPDWHMAFRHVQGPEVLPDGLSDFLNHNRRGGSFPDPDSLGASLLLCFKESIR